MKTIFNTSFKLWLLNHSIKMNASFLNVISELYNTHDVGSLSVGTYLLTQLSLINNWQKAPYYLVNDFQLRFLRENISQVIICLCEVIKIYA